MTQNSALKYNLLIIEAKRLGRLMKLLDKATADMPEPPFIDLCFEGFAAMAESLWAIGTVLRMIGDTPNGYINQEALGEGESETDVDADEEDRGTRRGQEPAIRRGNAGKKRPAA